MDHFASDCYTPFEAILFVSGLLTIPIGFILGIVLTFYACFNKYPGMIVGAYWLMMLPLGILSVDHPEIAWMSMACVSPAMIFLFGWFKTTPKPNDNENEKTNPGTTH